MTAPRTRIPGVSLAAHRLRRAYADARRVVRREGSARPVRHLLGPARRRDTVAWNAATSHVHEQMRARFPVAPGRVAIVCVSMRPHAVDDVVHHVSIQRDGGLDHDPEVVFVANAAGFDRDELAAAFAVVPNVRLLVPADRLPLGVALNRAMESTDARFVAKFDDDDRYGSHHLADLLRAHSYAGAGVVGRHSYYADLVSLDRRVIRFPGNEYRYSSALAGGTLVIDRQRTGDLRFEEMNLGEDQAFITACHRRGISTFSADRFNFVQTRATDNTWAVDDEEFLAGSLPVDAPDELVFR